MLVPRAEHHGHLHPVGCFQRVEEVGHTVYPAEELLVPVTSLEHGLHGVGLLLTPGVGHPRRAARERIVEMPRECDHAATVEVADNLPTHTAEGHAVQVDTVAQFQMSQVESYQGRFVAADALHVAAVVVAHPADAIDRIVLMAEHIVTAGRHPLQRDQQVLGAFRTSAVGHRVGGQLRFTATGRQQYRGDGNHKVLGLFHNVRSMISKHIRLLW